MYSCIHLLLKEEGTKNKNTYKTFLFLESNKNISVDKNEVLSVLSNFVDSGGCLFNTKKKKIFASINNHIESNDKKNKKDECSQKCELKTHVELVNPIPPGLWNDVVTWGGVFLTRSTFQPYNLVKSHATIKNLFPDKIFDIQTSFGTTISTAKEV